MKLEFSFIEKVLPFNYLISILRRTEKLKAYRSYEKAYSAYQRKCQDVEFLKKCRTLSVVPKFISTFRLPNALSEAEKHTIYKKSLNRKISQEMVSKQKLLLELTGKRLDFCDNVSTIMLYLCRKNIVKSVTKEICKKRSIQNKKLATLLQVSNFGTFDLSGTILNLSDHEISDKEEEVLKYGLKHGLLTPFNDTEVKSAFENLYFQLVKQNLVQESDAEIKNKIRNIANHYIKQNQFNSKAPLHVLSSLRKKGLKVCKFDKGNGVVILNDETYFSKMNAIIELPMFEKANLRKGYKPPNIKDEEKLKSIIDEIPKRENESELICELRKIYLKGCLPAKLYGLPKVHKSNIPMRPVLSTIGSANYKLAKILHKFLRNFNNSSYTCKDVFEFTSFINHHNPLPNECMVSFDVTSLFTMVPLDETIDICVEHFKTVYGDTDSVLFKKLLEFACKDVNFLYNDEWYIQNDGVSMGSPIAPVMADIFMDSLEKKISDYTGSKPIIYKRYVDDIFLVFENKEFIDPFLSFMNDLHTRIKFTVEHEKNKELPFLDVKVIRKEDRYITTQYFKPTDTSLYLTPFSMCDEKYQKALIKTLISRTWELNSNYHLATEGIEKMKTRLLKNGYKENFIDKNILQVIDRKMQPTEPQPTIEPKVFLSVQYGKGSKELKRSIKSLLPENPSPILLTLQTKKVEAFVSNKCRTPKDCSANLVYNFKCHGCDAQYIGETKRHLRTRVAEHRQKSRESAIQDHALHCTKRNKHIDIDEFTTIKDSFTTKLLRRYFESISIKKSKTQLINIKSKKKPEQLNIFV